MSDANPQQNTSIQDMPMKISELAAEFVAATGRAPSPQILASLVGKGILTYTDYLGYVAKIPGGVKLEDQPVTKASAAPVKQGNGATQRLDSELVVEYSGKQDGDQTYQVMAKALAPYFVAQLHVDLPDMTAALDEDAVKKIALEVAEEVAAKTTNITVALPNGTTKVVNGAHKQMPEIFEALKAKHVYLWGKPGSGKTTAAKQVADALGRDFGYLAVNAMTTESKIFGYMTPDGSRVVETAFSSLYTKSAVVCIDEADNGNANSMNQMNGAIENQSGQFPDGLRIMHPEFRVIATGNTAGLGGNIMHADRRPMDAAFRERFYFVEIEYDEGLEERMLKAVAPVNHAEVLSWWRAIRKWVEKNDTKIVVSPRGCRDFGYLIDNVTEAVIPTDKALDMAFFKGIHADTKRNMLSACPVPKFKRS
jgi:predicted Zn-ribbon and HTH transcriptional regulator